MSHKLENTGGLLGYGERYGGGGGGGPELSWTAGGGGSKLYELDGPMGGGGGGRCQLGDETKECELDGILAHRLDGGGAG